MEGATVRTKKLGIFIDVKEDGIVPKEYQKEKKDGYTLYKYDDLPHYFQYNSYIVTGYRKHLSIPGCLRSLFRLHNETGNVWTHLLALLYFFGLSIYVLFFAMQDVNIASRLVFVVYLGSAQLCFFGSTVYHLMYCHSEQALLTTARLDYSGISGLIAGSFFPPIYFIYYCEPFWQVLYLSGSSVLAIIGIVSSMFSCYHKASFTPFRVLLLIGTAAAGVIPSIHAKFIISLSPGELIMSNPGVVQNVYLMYLLYAVGVAFYVTKIPECYWKGRFDYWLNSHQFWHLFVIAATYVHYQNCWLMFQLWKDSGECPI